jgi:hypothetical protein
MESRSMRCAEHVACIGTNTNANKMVVGKYENKIPFGRR